MKKSSYLTQILPLRPHSCFLDPQLFNIKNVITVGGEIDSMQVGPEKKIKKSYKGKLFSIVHLKNNEMIELKKDRKDRIAIKILEWVLNLNQSET